VTFPECPRDAPTVRAIDPQLPLTNVPVDVSTWLNDGVIAVDIWSDIACPWCFLGKRRFEHALARFDQPVAVEYHSFELSPDTPVDFEGSEIDFLVQYKRIPKHQVEQMLAQMTGLGEGEGLHYDFAALRHTKTLLAHQAIHHAKAKGRQVELVERLFHGYFEQGRHVGHAEELVELGEDVGLDGAELRQALDDGTYEKAVAEDLALAGELGINGVPFYVLDGRYAVSGAQSSDLFLMALQKTAAEPE
jgi:predicted DsbA family dithiol-disulfide isomerase